MLHMRPSPDEYSGTKACAAADPRPTLRNRVHYIYPYNDVCYLPGALEATGQIAYPSRRQPNSDGRDGVAWGDGTHTAKGTGHEHTHSTVTRAARRALAHDVWHSMAAGGSPKSPLGHQCPGAALWLAVQLALDGDAASDVWLL